MKIDDILNAAEIIGKEPDKPQSQQNINNMKIAMRYAISRVAKIRSDEEIQSLAQDYANEQCDPFVLIYTEAEMQAKKENTIDDFTAGYKQAIKDIKEL